MDFKIEKGIPIPKLHRVGVRLYPVDKMEVGDSFFIPIDPKENRSSIRATVINAAKRIGIRVTTRSVADGLRVWRFE